MVWFPKRRSRKWQSMVSAGTLVVEKADPIQAATVAAAAGEFLVRLWCIVSQFPLRLLSLRVFSKEEICWLVRHQESCIAATMNHMRWSMTKASRDFFKQLLNQFLGVPRWRNIYIYNVYLGVHICIYIHNVYIYIYIYIYIYTIFSNLKLQRKNLWRSFTQPTFIWGCIDTSRAESDGSNGHFIIFCHTIRKFLILSWNKSCAT